MIFTTQDYNVLHNLVFRPDYPGYRPSVLEAPNGDGKLDTQKRYAHVATKYLRAYSWHVPGASGRVACLVQFLHSAHDQAMRIANRLQVPSEFLPSVEHGALRVLEYPAGAGASAMHTDFDLFTINCYRNVPNPGLPSTEVHMGELGELIGLGPATPHGVEALPETAQYSIVYFAIPHHDAVLPRNKCRHWDGSDVNVGKWIQERISRSRYDK